MGWRSMAAAAVVAAVIMMSYGAGAVAEEPRKDTSLQLEPLGINLRGRTFSSQKGAGQHWEDTSFADEPQMNYDYFVQPILETTHQLPPVVEQTFTSGEIDNDSHLGHASKRVTGINDKNLDVRKQGALQHGKAYSLYKQSSTELYQEEQTWPNKDPFSVFYDSMFPEMESVIPEEETYSKNIPVVPTKPASESTSSPIKSVSLHQAAADSSPSTPFTEVQSPTVEPVTLSSLTLLNTVSSTVPSPMNMSFDYSKFDKLITRMSLVLEKFGLSKSLTKRIFREEEEFLDSLMNVKSLREKINTISHLKLSAVTSKLNLSHLFSKFGFKDMASKLDISDVASKLGLSDMVFRMNLTDLVSKFDMDDIAYIVDLVEAASNLSLKDVASKMSIGHSNAARLLQMAVNQSRILAQIIDLESVHRAANMLGINETFMDGVFNRVETSARYVLDDDEGGKLIYLPLFDTVSLNVVQSLGFTVFLFFLLLSAYSFISLKTGTIARDGSQRPHVPLPPRPTSEWDLDNNREWKAAINATEGFDLPWEHNRDHNEGEDIHNPVVPRRPIPVPDPGALHRMSQHPSAHLKTHMQHTTTRRGPLIVPVVNFRGDHHIIHHNVNDHHTGHHQHATARPHHHFSRLQPPRQQFIQHSVQPFAQPQPYEPDHYDKHRHFASYEDDYQYEGKDQDVGDYFLDNKYHQYPDPHSEADLVGTSDSHWYSNPTTRPTDSENLHTYSQNPSLRTTWQSQRRTSPQPSSFPATVQPPTISNFSPTPTSLPNTRPTSKYAQRVKSSLSDKKGLNTRRMNFTRE